MQKSISVVRLITSSARHSAAFRPGQGNKKLDAQAGSSCLTLKTALARPQTARQIPLQRSYDDVQRLLD